MLYQMHQETVDEKIRCGLLITKFAPLWRHQLNNISHLFILVQYFQYADF